MDSTYHLDLTKVFSSDDIITIDQVIRDEGKWENEYYTVEKHNSIKCRWCKTTKSVTKMALIGFSSGVCDECMNAPDAEERHAKYLMEGMGTA